MLQFLIEMIWKIAPRKFEDLTKQLLFNRGIKTEEEINNFFDPSLDNFKKDLEITNIKKAQDRINKAIHSEELMVVYGDYDVDGVSASAILYHGLSSLGARVLPYIPHREKEGYGLSKSGLDSVRDSGASLVITVDNGIVALEQAEYAKTLGLDLIITDHHIPLDSARGRGPLYPEAFTIVHSTKMCGAAVAWCLIRDLLKKELSEELLQFVAIATVCDMISLNFLGRAFVVAGLKELNKTKNLGLKALVDETALDLGSIGSYEIGHILGPRINAIGRLEHAIDALRLFCTKDLLRAKKLAKLLCDANSERQRLTGDGVLEAASLVKEMGDKKIFVLSSASWSSGIIGLIAARVCEEQGRPAIAISLGEKVSKGSARSVGGINIVEVIRETSSLLIDIGGHKGAAGFSIATESVEIFKQEIEKVAASLSETFERVLEIEAEISSRSVTKSLVSQLDKFEPFGFGNPRPILATRGMSVADVRTVGEGKHLKLKADGIDAIGFGLGHLADLLSDKSQIDLAYCIEINKFNGREILQLKIKDVGFI